MANVGWTGKCVCVCHFWGSAVRDSLGGRTTMGFSGAGRKKRVAGLASVNILVTHTYSLTHLSGPLDPRN